MELFRYRNIALGCGCFLALLFASFYFNTFIRVAILVFAGLAALFLILAYAIKKSNKSLKLLTQALPVLLFIILSIVVSIIGFDKSEILSLCDGKSYQINATVKEVHYSAPYMGIYTVEIDTVNGKDINESVELIAYKEVLQKGDAISATGVFDKIEGEDVSYNYSKGIVACFEAEDYIKTGADISFLDIAFDKTNSFLDSLLKDLNEEAYPLLSALVLGNKEGLKADVSRDFSRLGLAHILALSGMHITIVVTILGYILSVTRLRRLYKELFLILSVLFFVGMTGFSPSALRAGIMCAITISLSFFGNRVSSVTTLFLSVVAMCIINPFNIFSVSLLLSFFAMLGCIASLKFIHRVRVLRKIRFKILRYIAISFITSLFAVIFTLPIIYVIFGNVSSLSVPANILLSPIFTLLMYLSPVYLVCAKIPYVGAGFGWVIEKICSFVLFIGRECAQLDNIVIPIINYIQIIGIFLMVSCALFFLVGRRRTLIPMLCGVCIGIFVFAIGTGMLYGDRDSNVYVGAHRQGSSEAVFVEDGGELTLFQIGNNYKVCRTVAADLGYYEIDNYALTDYSLTSVSGFERLCKQTIVRRLLLPKPESKDEGEMYARLNSIATEAGVMVEALEGSLEMKNSTVSIHRQRVGGSARHAVAIGVNCGTSAFTYLSSGVMYMTGELIETQIEMSDVIVFGHNGPTYKTEYTYNTPYIDYYKFLGESKTQASQEYLNRIEKVAKELTAQNARFKLSP